MLTRNLVRRLVMTTAFCMPLVITGCAARVGVGYRVYDPYRSDYHVWDDHEGVYYNRWTVETRRSHREFRKLHPDEQREYWKWRHDRRP